VRVGFIHLDEKSLTGKANGLSDGFGNRSSRSMVSAIKQVQKPTSASP
jgi:hypothetical protein